MDLARELKKLRKMRITVIPVVISALGMIPKVFEKDNRNWKSEEKLRPALLSVVALERVTNENVDTDIK